MRRDRFAAAALTDQSQNFPAPYGQIDAFDRADSTFVEGKGDPQVFDFQKHVVIHE
jgi:hypothetical protein